MVLIPNFNYFLVEQKMIPQILSNLLHNTRITLKSVVIHYNLNEDKIFSLSTTVICQLKFKWHFFSVVDYMNVFILFYFYTSTNAVLVPALPFSMSINSLSCSIYLGHHNLQSILAGRLRCNSFCKTCRKMYLISCKT